MMSTGAGETPTSWTVDERLDETAREQLRAELRLFNDAHVRLAAEARQLEPDPHPAEFLIRDRAGAVRGGLLGYTQWGWLHVQTLWLAESCRGYGLGRRVILAAEQVAWTRGCHHSRLGTYDFQARGFYERLGYTAWGQLADYPPGHINYLMVKPLTAPAGTIASVETDAIAPERAG